MTDESPHFDHVALAREAWNYVQPRFHAAPGRLEYEEHADGAAISYSAHDAGVVWVFLFSRNGIDLCVRNSDAEAQGIEATWTQDYAQGFEQALLERVLLCKRTADQRMWEWLLHAMAQLDDEYCERMSLEELVRLKDRIEGFTESIREILTERLARNLSRNNPGRKVRWSENTVTVADAQGTLAITVTGQGIEVRYGDDQAVFFPDDEDDAVARFVERYGVRLSPDWGELQ